MKELGLAEALLIGYKNDLDQTLVQAYTSTGVVHIIAISGMHLAIIYGMIVWLTSWLKNNNWLRVIIMIGGLWLFTLMAGGQASVVRSCVMFTCIGLGNLFKRKSSVFNTLALSAFLLLCYQPLWIWDIGFQLSYAAVFSILLFYRKIYQCLLVQNKLLDAIWKSTAITIAAQILTTPLSVYHFHQFPLLFLMTNLVAVPLSSLILFIEIFLFSVSWFTGLSKICGQVVKIMIEGMNLYIERLEKIPFALWGGLSISLIQVLLLFIIITGLYTWLSEKRKVSFLIAVTALLSFMMLRTYSFMMASHQKKMIVYHLPRHFAMELISGRSAVLLCDSTLKMKEISDYNSSSHTLYRIRDQISKKLSHDLEFDGRRMVIVDQSYHFSCSFVKKKIDFLILTSNAPRDILPLLQTFNLELVIMDGTSPKWKVQSWRKECDSLHLPYFDISEKGAFVRNL